MHWDRYWSNASNRPYWQRPDGRVLEFLRTLDRTEHPKVLDLGCGIGRHAIALAAAGFGVVAIDPSAEAIAETQSCAQRDALCLTTIVGDAFAESLRPASFDIVLSFNVIYHGLREDFRRAIDRVHELLRPGGLFYFTCPSRSDGKYGHGPCLAPHTYACERSVTPGDVHYFADEADLMDLLKAYTVRSLHKDEGYWDNQGTQQFSSTWHIIAQT